MKIVLRLLNKHGILADKAEFRTLTSSDFQKAYDVIKPYIHRTPVLTSKYFDDRTGRKVFFKAENFQKTGSFKARGAHYAIFKLLQNDPSCPGVIAHSSGNHGAALAYAARNFNLPCTIVTPSNSLPSKVAAIKGYGANVELCEPNMQSRVHTAQKIIDQTDSVLLHSFDNYDIIAGQGTIALEFLEQVPDLDAVIVPTGGGGMLAGVASCISNISPRCQVFAATPLGKNFEDQVKLKEERQLGSGYLDTVADGLRVKHLGSRNLPVIQECVDIETIFEVPDSETLSYMKLVFERMKVVIETSSGVGVAALCSKTFEEKVSKKLNNVGVILCGGNADLDNLKWN